MTSHVAAPGAWRLRGTWDSRAHMHPLHGSRPSLAIPQKGFVYRYASDSGLRGWLAPRRRPTCAFALNQVLRRISGDKTYSYLWLRFSGREER